MTPGVGAETFGPEVARWAKRHMPHAPMRWNRAAWSHLLSHDHGKLSHRQGLISVARQNSKTTAAEALVGWWMTDHADRVGPQTVLWLSHDLRLSEQVFSFLARVLEHRITYVTYSFGRQRFTLDNGSTFAITSNTINAGHGWSIDLCVADEAWRVKSLAISQGIQPAMRARPMTFLLLISSAGDEDSDLLRLWRERGLSIIESGEPSALAFMEWSMPPAADWHDPKWWAWPNPCLGVTLTPETLLSEFHSPDRGAYLRSALNVWTSSEAGWLQPGVWDGCAARSMPDPKGGVLACEISQGGERFYGVRAWSHNGIVYCQPEIVCEDEDQFWTACDTAYGTIDHLAITPTLEPHMPTSMARKSVVVGMKELARSVPLVRSMILAGQIAHAPSVMFDEHVGRAVATKTAGLSTAHSSGSIELARCLVWSASMSSRPQSNRKPGLAVAR
jgi:hypothetical protein